MTLLVAVVILVSTLIDSSAGCMRTETIDKERQWACWNFNRGGGYTSRDACCSGTTCECDETGSYTTNARFGRDCKCASRATYVDEYYARIMADQLQRINSMQQERVNNAEQERVNSTKEERPNSVEQQRANKVEQQRIDSAKH